MSNLSTGRALVTGASAGLGAALARRLAMRGLEVWLVARRRPLLERVVSDIRERGGRAHALTLDIGDFEQTHASLRQLDHECGGIDIVVANAALAGLPATIPLSRAPWQNTSELLRVNMCGAVATLSAFVPGMLERGRGHLVGISSLAAAIPNPRTPLYGATKAALSYFLASADIELRSRGITVTAVEPGFMRTPAAEGVSDPMPFILDTEASVSLIERAIERRARILRFPWQLVWLLRASKLLPRAFSRALIKRVSLRSQA
jgi:short-subunit dehydrogenase